jgi:hypothetical protein
MNVAVHLDESEAQCFGRIKDCVCFAKMLRFGKSLLNVS